MTKIGIAGDWHGDANSAIAMLKLFKNAGIQTVYHVGDFGIYRDRDGVKFLRAINRQLKLYGINLLVNPGNHEDYSLINSIEVGEDGLQRLDTNVTVLPRGYRWEIDGHSFVALGGAASINFTSLKKDISWWAEELITGGDLYRLAEHGEADVMITHEAPLGIATLETLKETNKDEWLPVELEYAYQSQQMMTYAVEIVRPKMFFHGHYHHGYIEETLFVDSLGGGFATMVHGLDMNRNQKNIGILDCETLAWEWLY